ncbi:ExeM/NucH family extracellular endonuclease [Nakamurella sp. GG22]
MRRRRPLAAATVAALTAGLVVVSGSPVAAVAPADGVVFVNEIHYDNDGTDVGEAIEVAGPAGTDLAGWSLVLYNGNGGAPYNTQPLSGVIPDQLDGFGVLSFGYPSNGIQNGEPDGVALVDASSGVVQFLSYEGQFTASGGPADGLTSTGIGAAELTTTPVGFSVALTGTGLTYGDFSWTAPATGSFGSVNPGQTFGEAEPPVDPCAVAVTHQIGGVQGSGSVSSLDDDAVTVEGVVVGDFQGAGQLGGVFLQDSDGDPATSDGIFVFAPAGPALSPGDVVRVSGTVDEYFGLTQISAVTSMGDCGDAAVPSPVALSLPAGPDARERLEGMLVSLAEPVTATESFTLARFGELVVSAGGRLFQPTNGGTADDAAEQAANEARRLVIDDGSSVQNPAEVPFTDVDGEVIRLGDTLTGVVGVLSYGIDLYRLQPTADPVVTRTNPRPAAPDFVGGAAKVASFNVLNYFTTIDVPGAVTDTGDDPRGADSALEFERQRAKIVAAISTLDADVVGLMEIENDKDDQAVDDLVSALNRDAGKRRYATIEEPGRGLFGTDAIKVAMIYQPARVVPMGRARTTTDEAFANARYPLAQRFRPASGGRPFWVVVNHFKSKSCGSPEPTGPNADRGDGQGCFNADRVAQATALARFTRTLDGPDVMVVGDLNSYGDEDPIDVLRSVGFVDLIESRLAEKDRYSYVFEGQAGYLDQALVTRQLARRITGVDIWHINADEALFLDYNTEFNPPGFYEPDPYRSSDHDPVLIGVARTPGKR